MGRPRRLTSWTAGLLLALLTPACATAEEAPRKNRLNREILDRSLELGQQYLVRNQTTEGKFRYEVDFITGRESKGQSIVRQAGALWGLTLTHQALPSKESGRAVERGLSYFRRQSKLEKGRRYFLDGRGKGRTGAIALVALSLIDLLRSKTSLTKDERKRYRKELDEYVAMLLSLRLRDGRFQGGFGADGVGDERPNPYFDGESLLCLTRAARYAGQPQLQAKLLASAERMYQVYVTRARKKDPDSNLTKGFYQWGTMAFYELYTSGWPEAKPWAERAIELGHWMIDTHRVLSRRLNTAYAYEGLVCAWELARLTGDRESQAKLGRTIDRGLYKLTTWQVAGPVPNSFLRKNPPQDARTKGGVLNEARSPLLRVDVTQHQMHAVVLARQLVYKAD